MLDDSLVFVSLLSYLIPFYSLRPEIIVGEMDVSRHILVLDTSIFMHFFDKYFRTEGVQVFVEIPLWTTYGCI